MRTNLKFAFLFLVGMALFTACEKEDDGLSLEGNVQFEITDAPIDDANVAGVFVTVTAVKVDGEPISGFEGPQTINLLAYQNGNTKTLGLAELETGTYSNVSLELDYGMDADGNAPGCYLITEDRTRHSLRNNLEAVSEIQLNNTSFTVVEDSTSTLVLDFDLRKSITYDSPGNELDKYEFVTESELGTSVRLVEAKASGRIAGNCQNNVNLVDRIVVYAYSSGTFDKDVEMNGQGESGITFKNAVASAVVGDQGDFTLAFLPEGEYELRFFAYEQPNDGKPAELLGELSLDLLGTDRIDLGAVQVDAAASVSFSLLATAIIP